MSFRLFNQLLRHNSQLLQFKIFKRKFGVDTIHRWHLEFPNILDSREAIVEKWLKKEGEAFDSTDVICEVTLLPSNITVAVDAQKSGYIAKLLKPIMTKCPITEPLALLVSSKEDLLIYYEDQRIAIMDNEMLIENQKVIDESKEKEKAKTPDVKTLLKDIKDLISSGTIEAGSDFAKQLLSQARKGNSELMTIYKASYENDIYDVASFDKTFFIENAKDIIDHLSTENNEKQQVIQRE